MKSQLFTYIIILILTCSSGLPAKQNYYESVKENKYVLSCEEVLIDTISSHYFPLAVGNVYKYHYASSGGVSYDYRVRIMRDTVINSKKYFVTNGYFPAINQNIIRYDSITGNIYGRVSSGYCSYSPFEELIDSLRSKKGDTALVCNAFLRHHCTDTSYATLFGNQLKTKSFTRFGSDFYISVTYGYNFGITFASYHDFWGLASERLTGCYMNGVLYGDTTLTGILNSDIEVPGTHVLFQNYPNPFNPSTIINYRLKNASHVSIKVYDPLGKVVAILVNDMRNAGLHKAEFKESELPSGIYFYMMSIDGIIAGVRRMAILK
jgi:hypothetical protein